MAQPWREMMTRVIARAVQALTTFARHAIPLGGIWGQEWHPVTALAVYWLESLLLALAAAWLAAMMHRRTSDRAIAEAEQDGDEEAVRQLRSERIELHNARIAPKDILLVYVGSFMIFAGFLAGVTLVLTANGHLEPPRWFELSQAAQAIVIVIAINVSIDLFRFNSLTPRAVQERVDACISRWAMFWLVGFVGTFLVVMTGRPTAIFGFFAVLKVIFESYARLARLFGWKSLKDRELAAPAVVVTRQKQG